VTIFRFLKLAAPAILDFQNFTFLTVGTLKRAQAASPCQISSKSLKPRPAYGDFSIVKDGGRSHLGFLNFKFLTHGTIKKFRRNRSNRGQDMAIFQFF